jgi:hypothetical protein
MSITPTMKDAAPREHAGSRPPDPTSTHSRAPVSDPAPPSTVARADGARTAPPLEPTTARHRNRAAWRRYVGEMALAVAWSRLHG